MFFYFKKAFISSSTLLLTLFLTISCMHVKSLEGLPETGSSREISLNLNRLNNTGGSNYDEFNSFIDSDEYYIAVGYSLSDLSGLTGGSADAGSNDFVIAKFNKSDLSLVSLNNLGGTLNDEFNSVIESDGYYIVTGGSQSNLSGLTDGSTTAGSYDFVIAKFNKSDLSLVSINNFGGTGIDNFTSIIEADGYYIAIGDSQSNLSGFTGGSTNAGSYYFVIAKFNKADLSLVRINNFGGTSIDIFNSLIEADEYYIAVGYSLSNLSGFTGGSSNAGNYDFVIAKFNKSDLSLVNLNNLGGTAAERLNSVIDSEDHYIAAGYSSSDLSGLIGGTDTAGSRDFVIAKFNKSDLSLVNLNNLGGTSSDTFNSLIESGSYYIAVGYSYSDLSNFTDGNTNSGADDFAIAKFNQSDLSLVSLNNLGGTSSDYLNSVIESNGYYTAIGASQSNLSGLTGGSAASGNYDFTIIKFGN